jgi:hypothetical protein
VREAEKKLIKKQRQSLRAIAEGQGQQRLLSEGGRGLHFWHKSSYGAEDEGHALSIVKQTG